MTSVGRSLPGTMIGNVAMLYGYRVAGVAGGMACLFGMILPPLAVLAVITQFYTAFQNNLWVAACAHSRGGCADYDQRGAGHGGQRVPLSAVPVMLLVIALYLFFNVNCVYLVVIGASAGC